MHKFFTSGVLALTAVLAGGMLVAPGAQAATTGNSARQSGSIVSAEPSRATPNILDGTVYSVTQVGNQIVVGGSFTQVENFGTSTVVARNHLMAFDATTGKINTTFAPDPDGVVYKVQAAADGTSVYVGGKFANAGGRVIKNLFEADVASGVLTAAFKPANLDGEVRDLEVTGGRLWVGGKFTHLGGKAQKALGTLSASTGAYDPYFTGVLSGLHNPGKAGSVTDVLQLSTNPANTELVAVGNFTTVNGQSRSQILKLDIGAATYALSSWNTTLFTQACSSSFDTYMTDVEFSPDGSYFVVATTGAYGGSGSLDGTSGCDVVARFEGGATPTATPTWTAYTGGDTTWTVEVTDSVVYTGGHMRWQNNPTAGDQPGQGAVARAGIAALNPVTGVAYSWNPTRSRGVGVQDLLATADGLYVGSDTTLIGSTAGNTYHARIAMLPLSTGRSLPKRVAVTLPADLYTVPTGQSLLTRRTFDGSTVSSTGTAPSGPGFGSSVGAFMVNGTLYTATSNGTLTKQTFDGTMYGAASTVATADALTYQSDWHVQDVPSLTSLFYVDGRIYFTKAGQNALFSRGFEPESDIVGQQRFGTTSTTFTYSGVRGAFVAGGSFYFATSSGQLYRTDWSGTAATGTPVLVSGPGVDSQNWASRTMFAYQGVPNQLPTAAATVSCSQLTCTVDGTASSDPDGTIASYDWDFGDGSTHGTGATTTHTYADAGDRTVTLTVTDNRGGTADVTRTANPATTANPIAFVAATSVAGNRTNHAVTIPASTQAGDTLLVFFTASTTTQTYTGPAGWTAVGSQDGGGVSTRAWSKVATASDAGTSVAVSSSAIAKSEITVAAYRGTAVDAVGAAASKIDTAAGAAHTSPAVTAADSSSWLVTYWADKSTSVTAWTAPSGQTVRSSAFGTLSGHVDGLLADSNAAVTAGPTGRLTASTDVAGSRGASFSVLLRRAP